MRGKRLLGGCLQEANASRTLCTLETEPYVKESGSEDILEGGEQKRGQHLLAIYIIMQAPEYKHKVDDVKGGQSDHTVKQSRCHNVTSTYMSINSCVCCSKSMLCMQRIACPVYEEFTARRFVHIMYDSLNMSCPTLLFTLVERRASGSLALTFRS